jgi:hypothetical protein
MEASMAPSQVAKIVFDAIEREQFYILTHPESTEVIQPRTERLLRMENPLNPAATIMKLTNAHEQTDVVADGNGSL